MGMQSILRFPAALTVGGSALLNGALWVLVLTKFPQDTPAAILHYSVGSGVDFIGEGQEITTLPLIGSLILLCNTAMAYGLRNASFRALWIFIGILPILQVALLAAFVLLLRVN
ncbi:MAG: hypothetical protein WEC84_03925 [Candidatus Andersenbacteria bacterium]